MARSAASAVRLPNRSVLAAPAGPGAATRSGDTLLLVHVCVFRWPCRRRAGTLCPENQFCCGGECREPCGATLACCKDESGGECCNGQCYAPCPAGQRPDPVHNCECRCRNESRECDATKCETCDATTGTCKAACSTDECVVEDDGSGTCCPEDNGLYRRVRAASLRPTGLPPHGLLSRWKFCAAAEHRCSDALRGYCVSGSPECTCQACGDFDPPGVCCLRLRSGCAGPSLAVACRPGGDECPIAAIYVQSHCQLRYCRPLFGFESLHASGDRNPNLPPAPQHRTSHRNPRRRQCSGSDHI